MNDNPTPSWTARMTWHSVPESARAYFRASPMERIGIVKSRVPARYVAALARHMQLPREKLYASLRLGRATVDRKIRNAEKLTQEESERVLAITRLVGQAEAIVQESGTPEDFDAATWVGGWLQRPHPALGGYSPAELMDTADGRAVVTELLAQQQSGVYA